MASITIPTSHLRNKIKYEIIEIENVVRNEKFAQL